MRIESKLVRLAVVVLIFCASRAVHAQTPLAIKISPTHDGITVGSGVEKAGSPILVIVELTNDSGKDVSVSSHDYAECYTFEVLDAEGYPAPETEWMREWKNPGRRRSGHGVIAPVKTGVSWKEQLRISDFYDLSRPGTYTIQVERKLPEELGTGTVTSNTITITVLPADDTSSTQK